MIRISYQQHNKSNSASRSHKLSLNGIKLCDSHLPFLSNISSVYVTPAAPVFPPVPRDDVHLSFRLWYEGVASSNKGAGGGRSPVVANTVELQKKNDNKTVVQ